MRRAPDAGLPFLPLDLPPGFSSIGAAPLPEFRGADAPPSKQPEPNEFGVKSIECIECIESDDNAYTTLWWYDACWRVLFSNPPAGDKARRSRVTERRTISFLGQNGHIERISAWVHIGGGTLFLVFGLLRPSFYLDQTSRPGVLSALTSLVVAATFMVSTLYHTLGTVRRLAPITRMFDHGAIDVALAVACTADAAVVTLDFHDVPWQTVFDAIFVAAIILCFFLYRRLVLPPEDTEIGWGNCQLGLFRLQHADFEYSALRSSSYIVLSFGFLMLVPAALRNLTAFASSTLIVCNGASLFLLVVGLLLDNVLMWPDVLYQDAAKRRDQNTFLLCHNTRCGCMMNSHAWWHVLSLLATVILTVGREVAIASTDFTTPPF